MTPIVMPWGRSTPKVLISNIRIGSVVRLRPNFGQDAPVLGTVVSLGTNAGRDVIDYLTPGVTRTHWAYLHQVDSVVTY